jgi:8-oxo-dGTP diphosphatase
MSEKVRLVFVAACALFDTAGRVLLAERPEGKTLAGLWEFPGGKIEDGERPENALVRELHEELAITVAPGDLEPFSFASHAYENFHLLMPLYICRTWRGEVMPMEGQRLAWVPKSDLNKWPMPPADRPLVSALLEREIAAC